MTYLCHHNVIKPNPKIQKMIFAESEKTGEELLQTLSIDMALQTTSPKELLGLLLKTARLREGKRFLRVNWDKL